MSVQPLEVQDNFPYQSGFSVFYFNFVSAGYRTSHNSIWDVFWSFRTTERCTGVIKDVISQKGVATGGGVGTEWAYMCKTVF